MECHECHCTPENNDERYYSVRRSDSGKEFEAGMVDEEYCEECLVKWIDTNGISTIVSILRIHNPTAVGDV